MTEIISGIIFKLMTQIAFLTVAITILAAVGSALTRSILGRFKTLLKLALSTLVLAAGLLSATQASAFKPNVDLANSKEPITMELDSQFAIPSNAIPSNAIPSNAIPSNAIPSNAIPSNSLPSAALPASALPASAIPSNAIPSNIASGAKLQRLPDFGERVCKDRCDEDTKYTTYSNQTGIELAGSSGPIDIEFWADDYYLTPGECTNMHWNVINADNIWFDGSPTADSGNTQVCPSESKSYNIAASNLGGYKGGSLVYIEVQQPQAQQPPAQQPSTGAEPPKSVDRCSLFDNIDMTVTYLDWISGAPLQFHIKMPGGVPGLEKDVEGDSGSWQYTARIGDYTSTGCNTIQGYKERLYCTISLPSTYSNAMRPMTLSINGCDTSIYKNHTAFLPAAEDASSSGAGQETGGSSSGSAGSTGGSSGSGDPGTEYGNSCGPAPSNTNASAYQAWCTCSGGTPYGPVGEQYWVVCNY